MQSNAPDAVLQGIRVLELAGVEGQYCGKLLADMGADVIKVEAPGGDAARRIGPFANDWPDSNKSLNFWYYNTSKRSITLEIWSRTGQDLLRRLVDSADVVLESFAPGAMDAAGIGFGDLSRQRHDLIMVSITPFGQTGPWHGFRGSDLVNLALAGTMAMNGYDDVPDCAPIRPDGQHAWAMASEFAFVAVLSALLERTRTGGGQWLDVSTHEACACTTEGAFANWEYFRRVVKRQTGRHAQANPTRPWQHRSKDGRFVNLMGGGVPRMYASWRPLLQWMDEHGMAADLFDERFESVVHRTPSQRFDADTMHVLETLAAFARALTAEEIYRKGQSRRLPWATIRAPEENLDDPHWQDRGFFADVDHPEIGGTVRYPGAPFKFSRTPWRIRSRAPLVGEHNVQVYVSELGLDRQELRELFEQGVV